MSRRRSGTNQKRRLWVGSPRRGQSKLTGVGPFSYRGNCALNRLARVALGPNENLSGDQSKLTFFRYIQVPKLDTENCTLSVPIRYQFGTNSVPIRYQFGACTSTEKVPKIATESVAISYARVWYRSFPTEFSRRLEIGTEWYRFGRGPLLRAPKLAGETRLQHFF